MIYLDNAATTKIDKDALDAYIELSKNYYGNPSQPYSFGVFVKKKMEEARNIIADCIGSLPDEIYFTSGGTESDNWAINGTNINSKSSGVLISEIEHHAIINPCSSLKEKVSYVGVDSAGKVKIEDFKKKIQGNRLASIMLVNNELGTLQPIKELAEIAHDHNVYFHTDAVQGVGHLKVNVVDLGVDLLSASAHKFNGPKGVGFLYIKRGTPIITYQAGGSQEKRLRAGTENIPGIYAMAIALEKNCKNIDLNRHKIMELESKLIAGINSLNIEYILNASEDRVPGIMSLSFKDFEGESILHRLDLKGICVATGAACDSKETQVSHVLKSIDLDKTYALGTIRISIGRENTTTDIEDFLRELAAIFKR